MDLAGKWRLGGLVLGLTIAISMMHGGTITFAVPAFAGCLLLGVLIGEIALPRPQPGKRAQAMLEVRNFRDYLPQPTAWGVVAMSLVSGVTVVTTPLLLGEQWARQYGMDSSEIGAFSGIPALVTMGAGLGLGWLLLSRTVKYPRTGVEGEALRQDDAWRRRTAQTLTAACGVLVSVPVAGAALLASSILGGDDSTSVIGWCAGLVAAITLVVAAHYIVMLLRPQVTTEGKASATASDASAEMVAA